MPESELKSNAELRAGEGALLDLVLSCEHATAHVPTRYRRWFAGYRALLRTHRAVDFGAEQMALDLAREFGAPLVLGRVTRLLIELNRSRHRSAVFSEIARELPERERRALLEEYFDPHWQEVRRLVTSQGRVLHVGVHSFTPVLHGVTRRADIGILYDPQHRFECRVAHVWRDALHELAPDLQVRRNYPYRGTSDAITTVMRRELGARRYAGIELEVNQRLALPGGKPWQRVRDVVAASLAGVLDRERR